MTPIQGVRGHLLRLIALLCSLSALAALLDPDRVAAVMGLFLVGVNGYSQFYAIYVGTRLATAALALLAARQDYPPILGDFTAVFILAQPAGRLIAATAIGFPRGTLLWVSALELVLGLALLVLRPGQATVR
jgi:hypothetical protein